MSKIDKPKTHFTTEDFKKQLTEFYETLPTAFCNDSRNIYNPPKWYIDAVMNPPLLKDKK